MVKPDGGSAFPYSTFDQDKPFFRRDVPGMSLRDYFAAKFAAGVFASVPWIEGADNAAHAQGVKLAEMIAAKSYEYADAMLAERDKA